jgi:hypothetical protein
MTGPMQDNQPQENKPNEKDVNFRALEARYKQQLEEERKARLEAERRAEEALKAKQTVSDEDDDDEPYVDRKKLNKTLAKFGEQTKEQTQGQIQKAVQQALAEERRQTWLKSNPDFVEVMQHAEKFAQHDPELAETILNMPEGFERQKLVYKNIKALGLHKAPEKQQSIQDKIDANRRSPYYQPTSVGAAPYSQVGDFTPTGQKQAYDKMKQLQKQLRI